MMKKINQLFDLFCMSMMGVLAISVIITVGLRYIFNMTFAWAEEAITFVFIATTYFGVVIGVREREHICIDFVATKVSPCIGYIMSVLRDIGIIGIHYIILQTSLLWISKVGNVVAPSLRIPLSYFYYMMPLSALLVLLITVVQLYGNTKSYIKERSTKGTFEERGQSRL